jgi:hypothetical protein
MRVDPMLHVNIPHLGHRLADDRGGQVRDVGRNPQHQPADFLERAAGSEGRMLTENRFDDVGGRQPGGTGWKLGCLVLDLLQYPRF